MNAHDGPTWLRLRAHPKFCGPVSVGTIAPVQVLRESLGLALGEAKDAVDRAVFGVEVVRLLAPTARIAAATARALMEAAPEIVSAWTEPQQRVDDLVLIIPNKPDIERDAVAAAWELSGGSVLRLERFWEPPGVPREKVRLYGPDTFALVVADKLSLALAEPDPYSVVKCPPSLRGRDVRVVRLGDTSGLVYPSFMKPVIPKQFRAAVFSSHEDLLVETRGLDDDIEVLRSEVMQLEAEARSFLLDGVVQACALYEGAADVNLAAKTCERVAMALDLPRAAVLDVGLLKDGRWVFIEANAAWGAGLNGCDPHSVLAAIAAATEAR